MSKNKDRSRAEQGNAPAAASPTEVSSDATQLDAAAEEVAAPESDPAPELVSADAPAAPSPEPESVQPEAPADPEPEPTPAVHEPWRYIALCIKSCTIAFVLGNNKVLGGEWIREQEHVRVIMRDPSFRLFPVESSDQIDEIIASHTAAVAQVTRAAAELGMVVYQDGAMIPARR